MYLLLFIRALHFSFYISGLLSSLTLGFLGTSNGTRIYIYFFCIKLFSFLDVVCSFVPGQFVASIVIAVGSYQLIRVFLFKTLVFTRRYDADM